jgi:hypothetical protein
VGSGRDVNGRRVGGPTARRTKNIVRGRFRFLGGEVNVATVVGDKNVLVSDEIPRADLWHILVSLVRANENGCRVSRGRNGERGGSKYTRDGGLKERGDGKE